MIIKEQLYFWKSVEYFGYNLVVPGWTKYMACDEDGSLYAYSGNVQPEGEAEDGNWWYGADNFEKIAIFCLEGVNWKETLVEVG